LFINLIFLYIHIIVVDQKFIEYQTISPFYFLYLVLILFYFDLNVTLLKISQPNLNGLF